MGATAYREYRVFGGVLRTTLLLPELHESPDTSSPTWTLEVHEGGAAPGLDALRVASEEVAGDVTITLHRTVGGASRLSYSDTGAFDVSSDGATIDWYRLPSAPDDLARTDILGRVLALAAHASGTVMLHASGVAIGDRVIGFLAPKFFGKSTLACAMTDAGARLVTDDALALRLGRGVECAPGVPALRLRREAAAHLRGASGLELSRDDWDWRHLERRDVSEVANGWLPVDALYVIQPVESAAITAAVVREVQAPLQAALALVRFAKLGGLLAGALAVDYLGRAADIAARVPVYALSTVRDLGRLEEVAAGIRQWHRD